MNERQLVSDVLAVLKSHVDDPFLMGQIARAEDDIDLERPVPDFRHEAQRFADYVSTAAYGRADSPDKLTRRHIYDAVLGALRDRAEWSATPPAYDPPEPDPELEALLEEEDRIARGGTGGVGALEAAYDLPGPTLDEAVRILASSGAHAPDLPETETELAGQITYRSTGRGAYDVVQSRAEGPAVVLAMVQFSEGVRGRVHALERFIDSLRKNSQDVQP